ncbi:MAG: hypothetical protein ACPGQL_10970 [Thermoplasmatota archaeon]
MRSLLVAAALCLLLTAPAASAAQDPPVWVVVDPDVAISPDGCDDCVHASLTVAQVYDNSCADCPGVWATVSVDHDGENTTVGAEVCRGGFVVICVVDDEITV